MQVHCLLTQRFTSEFGIRPFIQRYPDKYLALLTQWVANPNHHMRRWVSEGIRQR
jgi:3-methyladenine DNA glycosylase AlkC